MIFWLFILIGGLCAWLGVRKGFYAMFATLFCLMFAVYIGVLAAPKIMAMSEGLEKDPGYAAGCVFGMTLLIFGLLWSVAWFYFLRDIDDYFPKLFDRIGGGALGFLFGYVLVGLCLLLVCILPFSQGDNLPALISRDSMIRLSVPAVAKACNFVAFYSLECFYGNVENTLMFLLSLAETPT